MAVPQSGNPQQGARLMEISELAALLADRIDTLVPDLLPAAIRDGHEWRIGSVAGEAGRSMGIHRSGAMRGVWKDFSGGEGGDALDLVSACRFGGNKSEAVKWSKSWLGLDGLDPDRLKAVKIQARAKAKQNEADAIAQAEKIVKIAKAIWLNGSPVLADTPVENYLLGRGIDLRKFGKSPGSIRYRASLDYPQRFGGGKWPAMVSAIINCQGEHIATHRTYLQQISETLVRKAPVQDAKLSLGSYRGGFISISKGPSGKSLRDAPAGDKVIICEGIEDGLVLAMACPEYRVMAAISISNFRNIKLPIAITDVVIAADNDAPGSPAARALQLAVDYFIDEGKRVRIARAPQGKDFNDYFQAEKK